MTKLLYLLIVTLFNLVVGFSLALYLGRGPRQWHLGLGQRPAPGSNDDTTGCGEPGANRDTDAG